MRCVLLLSFLLTNSATTYSSDVTDSLEDWLAKHQLNQEALTELTREEFAQREITADQAASASERLWAARLEAMREERAEEHEARRLVRGELAMPFWYRVFGDKPEGGRSLYISMHGGGGAPARVNDGQYENQKRLYEPEEGVYLVPRAPTNTWNLWHQGHIDPMFDRLIANMVAFEGVNPNRVYVMGYSAGGDGVYQLAPRMADRWAAAAMMAGHPNEARPEGLRNIGFTIHMGGNDSAYQRNAKAAEWKTKLEELQKQVPDGYRHEVVIHEGMGHWMQRKDAVAVPWMARFTRNPFPAAIDWVQDDVLQTRFYWLRRTDPPQRGDRLRAEWSNDGLKLTASRAMTVDIYLPDAATAGETLKVVCNGAETEAAVPARTIASLAASLLDRDDPAMMSSRRLNLTVPEPTETSAD